MRALALIAVVIGGSACRDAPPRNQLEVSADRQPRAAPAPDAALAPPVTCEVFAREVGDALVAVLRQLARDAPRDRIDAYMAASIVPACDVASDSKWASTDRRAAVATCLAAQGPVLERASRCFPETISYNALDRYLVLGAPTGATADQRAVLARARGAWQRPNGSSLRIAGRSASWRPANEPPREDTIVDRAGPTDILTFEQHTHELAVARDGRRLLVLGTAMAQEQPMGPGPRLHDLDGGYGLVLDPSACRAITPSGQLVEAVCDRSSDSLEVTVGTRAWQLVVFDTIVAPAEAVEGIYTRAR